MLTVAIVGRPNVGKSSLFNRIAGKRIAIVDEMSGVTRDRLYTTIDWYGSFFRIIDTGGIVTEPDRLESFIERQAEFALAEADIILFMVDGQVGRTALDDDLVERIRRSDKTVWVVVNKLDNDVLASSWTEFSSYGWKDVYPISTLHNRGVADMLDDLSELANEFENQGAEDESLGTTAVAIVGRPNAGKSSLVNCISGTERSIVSDIAGTTRDAVDVDMVWPYKTKEGKVDRDIIMIDTAGIKRRRTVKEKLDIFSISRAETAIKRASVAILLLDATAGITVTDKKIANTISDAGTGCVIGINKWDLMQGKFDRKSFRNWVYEELSFLSYAPLVFLSALKSKNIDAVINKACEVDDIAKTKITTGILNRAISKAFEQHSPPFIKGRRLKFYYATQTKIAPPTFLLFVNDPERVMKTYTSYLIGQLRDTLGFEGSPIIIKWRSRSKK